MSFLSRFGFGRSRKKIEELERRVSRLQEALRQRSESVERWTGFRREVTGAIAILTVRVWKKRPELQAHSRFTNQSAYGLPVATGAVS